MTLSTLQVPNTAALPPVIVPKVTFSAKLAVGASAAIFGTCLIYPLDMMKTQIQTSKGVMRLSGLLDSASAIVAANGPRGLYKGLGTNLAGMTPEKALKMAVNDTLRDYFESRHADGKILMREELFAGAVAGTIQVVITCPMEIVKIRLQTQASMPQHLQTGPMQIISQLGARGLYRGAAVTMMRDIPFSIIFFPGFANLKKLFADEQGNTSFGGMLAAGMMAGAVAAGSVTPFDVIKTRIQSGNTASYGASVMSNLGGILRHEGPRALFKGAAARMCIFAPLFGIVQSAFEMQKMWLEHRMKKRNNL